MFDMQSSLSDLVNKFGETVEESNLSLLLDKLVAKVNDLQKSISNKENIDISLLHHSGITLWNFITIKKAQKLTSSLISAKSSFVALNLIFIAASGERSQTSSRKILGMAMKVGKEWLDLGNFESAEKCFVIATECYMKLQSIIESKEAKLTKEQNEECDTNIAKVNVFRAEIALKQNQHAIALEYFRKACSKGVQNLKVYLFNVAYNFGLDCYQRELYQFAVEWLCESCKIIDPSDIDTDKNKQASLYQLLSLVYNYLPGKENLEKAVVAAETSNQIVPNYKNIHLKIKISAKLKFTEEKLIQAFESLCSFEDLDVQTALQSVDAVASMESVAEKALELVSGKFAVFVDNLKVQLKKLEIIMSNGKINQAKELIEGDLMKLNMYGSSFDKDSLKQLHLLLWEQAQSYYEKGEMNDALKWYDYSYAFMKQSPDDKVNMAKLQRNRCSCLIELKDFVEAEKIALEGLDQQKASPFVHFLLFKIYLMQGKEEDAIKHVQQITEVGLETEDLDTVYGLICMAAQLAFERQNLKISEVALRKLLDQVSKAQDALVVIRCLTRLKFSRLSEETKKDDILFLISLIEKALEKLNELKANHSDNIVVNEVSWFNKIAWNVALSCKDLLAEMGKAFLLCYQLSLHLPESQVNHQQQKTCLLMAAGCSLSATREAKLNDTTTNNRLLEVLDCVSKCKEICSQLDTVKERKIDVSAKYLLLYEFEAKVRLGYKDLDSLLDITLNAEGLQKAKIFESFAGIASSIQSEEMSKLSVKCLKLSIKCSLEDEKKDFDSLSQSIHNLINMTMQKGSFSNAASKEEAFTCYTDALNVVELIAKDSYPEMEIVWMMTKAWNCGIHLYSANHFEEAEKWCTLSMKFLKHLNQLKNTYESHMVSVYGDISKKINQSKIHAQIEE